MIDRLRRRLARTLVGPFVTIPERRGAWVVMRFDDGRSTAVYQAKRFRLRMGTELQVLDEKRSVYRVPAHVRPRTTGRFVGTVEVW